MRVCAYTYVPRVRACARACVCVRACVFVRVCVRVCVCNELGTLLYYNYASPYCCEGLSQRGLRLLA